MEGPGFFGFPVLLGEYVILKECNPNEIYKWFMEMYIDAYYWVMVPNVYGLGNMQTVFSC